MNIARILYPIEVLGYGKRVGIWFAGCPHKCISCSNPELWEKECQYEITPENLMSLINDICSRNTVDGFTITGGEPFFQSNDLDRLTAELGKINNDILVYSGYTLKELQAMQNESVDRVLARIAVLIDGRYIESKNNGAFLRGSDNQKVYIMNGKYELRYDSYLKKTVNEIQNFSTDSGIVSVGIHNPGFKKTFDEAVPKKGLVDKNE